jgi:hypothetical protein
MQTSPNFLFGRGRTMVAGAVFLPVWGRGIQFPDLKQEPN